MPAMGAKPVVRVDEGVVAELLEMFDSIAGVTC